jgi:hypothetical protein
MTSFRSRFNPCGLKIPPRNPCTRKRTLLCAKGFTAPPELLLDGYCTPAEDQGATPRCAAFAASNFAESVLWRVNGRPVSVDPAPLYAHAKTLDGDPDGEGTYLECALEALKAKGWFPRNCQVRTFGNSFFGYGEASGLDEVKFAVHRYGCCVAGFNITDEWFSPKRAVVAGGPGHECQGGHAVLICGYDAGGVLVMNSWGAGYGRDGKVYVANRAFERQFMYGAVLTKVMDGLD